MIRYYLQAINLVTFSLLSNFPPSSLAAETTIPTTKETMVPKDFFTIADESLEVTVWATTPQLYNPTNIDFDIDGRLYVSEGVNYREAKSTRPAGDRVIILEDTDGNGKADKSSVFIQDPNLEAPLGVAVVGDKVIVSQPPDLLVYTDINGDRKYDPAFDKKETLLTGFNSRQHDHSLHSLTVGPDGQWNFNNGNCGAIFTDQSGKTFHIGGPYSQNAAEWKSGAFAVAAEKSDDGNLWLGGFSIRMNPDGTNARVVGHNYRNSYEQTITSYGDMFQSDNDDPPACRVSEVIEGGNAGFASADGKRTWEADKRPGQDTPTAEWRQEDPGTMPPGDVYGGGSPTGVAYYENGALGEKWQGLLLACDAGRNLIFGYLPIPDGAGFTLKRMDFFTSNKEGEFAGSDFAGGKANSSLKTNFRPSDVTIGPDGALYVADWYDARVGGHETLDKGGSGTIYRIAPKGFKSVVPKIDLNTTAGQITALKSPAVNVRNSGFTRLKAQGEGAVPAVAAMLKDSNPYLAARAVWLMAQLGPTGEKTVVEELNSKEPRQRLLALRALRAAGADMLMLAARLATDPAAMVRREIALSLRGIPAEKSVPILAKIAKQFDGKDRSYLEALGLGSTGKEAAVYAAAHTLINPPASPEWSDSFAWLAWRLHPDQAVGDLKARALAITTSQDNSKLMLTALAFNESLAASSAMIELANTTSFPHKNLAKWWINNRKNNLWKSHHIDETLTAMGQNPEAAKLTAIEMPAVLANAPKMPPVSELMEIHGDKDRGKVSIGTCYMCHQVNGQGIEYGPNLSNFGKQQPTEVILGAIAYPSATISHGYEGSIIKTTDNLTITGMILSSDDPVMIKCMGDFIQMVPKSKIASIKPLGKSLMFEPSNLGLTPQSVADITAYLKSL
jgi:putative membrane-bound dehydrogenase-like protein